MTNHHSHDHGDHKHAHDHGDHKHAHDHGDHKHAHDHGECSGCSHDDHSHAQVSNRATIIGGLLLLASFAVDLFTEKPDSIQAEIAAFSSAVILGAPVIWTAIKDILQGRFFMNELVGLAVLAAFSTGDYRTAAAVAFFMLIAVMIEHRTAVGARESIENLVRMTPQKARRINKDNQEEDVDVSDLALGDIIRIRPGELFSVDGHIHSGFTTASQASITGESLPADKSTGDEVYAGTLNLTSLVDIKVSRIGEDTTMGQVKDLMLQAENSRLPVMRLIDQYTAYYVPTILMIAAIVYYFTGFDIERVIAVLVIACPCALVVATPSAVVATLAAAARLGILIKDVGHLELAARIDSIVFDKTGTLTKGELQVSKLVAEEGIETADLLQFAASLERHSNHPAAKAVVNLAKKAELPLLEAQEVTEVPGCGVRAILNGQTTHAGRFSWLELEGIKIPEVPALAKGKSLIGISSNNKFIGWIALSDTLRSEAPASLLRLKQHGIRDINLVSGDNLSVSEEVAGQLEIDNIQADCLPQDKVAYVKSLKGKGKQVMVVGDGVNDAPALAEGHVSVAMGAIGSDIAVNSASIVLMNNDLNRIPFLIDLSKISRRVMNQNLLVGLLSILIGMLLSISGRLDGVEAAILHNIATLAIILNSARLIKMGEYEPNAGDLHE